MLKEVTELKWLLLPLYPFLVIVLFGLWVWVRARNTPHIDVKVRLLGMAVELRLDATLKPEKGTENASI